MSSKGDIPHKSLIFHELEEVLCLVVGGQLLVVIIMFLFLFVEDGGFESLPIFLFDHDFCIGVHFFVGLVIFFILMKDDFVLVGGVDNLAGGLLGGDGVFRLFRLAVNIGANVVAELIVEILIHCLVYYKINIDSF